MGDNEEEYELQLSINSYEKSDIIISIILGIIDIFFIIFFSIYLKTENRKVNHLKQKLLKVFLIDFISRLLYTKKYSSWTIYKEISFSFMNLSQFYLIISFISSALEKSKRFSKMQMFLLCVIFFFITFSYERFSFSASKTFFQLILNKLFLILQSSCILYCIYKVYEDFKKYIYEIANSISCSDKELSKIYLFILGSPQSCLILFTIYYVLKIFFTFINNPVYIIYSKIVLNILKEAVKYFSFCVCQGIIYQYYSYKLEEDEIKEIKALPEETEKLKI